jgi:hypothetical protein
VLVRTEAGLRVQRFPTRAGAVLAGDDRETSGLPVVLVPRICAWCRSNMGAVACETADRDAVTHGICPACAARMLAELPGVSCAVSSATAGRDRQTLPPGAPSSAAAVAGVCPMISPVIRGESSAKDRHSLVQGERLESEGLKQLRCGSASADAGSPAPLPLKSSLLERFDRWLKSWVTGRRIDE